MYLILRGRECSPENCPKMSGGPQYEYLWKDDKRYKTPTKLSAPEYIMNLVEWVDDIYSNEKIFPVTVDKPFPRNFKDICKKILQRLYRIFVHIYIEHFERYISTLSIKLGILNFI